MDNRLRNPKIYVKILSAILHAKGEINITVQGDSMNPLLHNGDFITIKVCNTYEPGDILLYFYENEGLLIHRLLQKDTRYYCKGDNAFRLESLSENDIIGKAVAINSQTLLPWPDWKVQLSLEINHQFRQAHYNVDITMHTDIYRLYSMLILKKEGIRNMFRKNEQMDFISTDQTSLAVFDPDSGNIYFFDETGVDILNALCEPCEIDVLLNRLCQIYDATPNEIRNDVEEFLADAIQKKVVLLT